MKFATDRLLADPAARKLLEIGNSLEPYADDRPLVELLNHPFLKEGGSPAEYGSSIEHAIAKG